MCSNGMRNWFVNKLWHGGRDPRMVRVHAGGVVRGRAEQRVWFAFVLVRAASPDPMERE